MRNKFDSISFIIEKNVDILLISEIKLNDSFLLGQFKVWGYGIPYWYGRGSMVDRILLRIRDNIPTKILKHGFGTNM